MNKTLKELIVFKIKRGSNTYNFMFKDKSSGGYLNKKIYNFPVLSSSSYKNSIDNMVGG